MTINGRLIVIPSLNFPAVMNGTRTSPIDGANLNRVFPGKRNGNLTEMIAHYLDTELFPLTDLAFDIHAGGASTNYLPTLLAAPPADPAQSAAYRKIVHALGVPRVMIMDLLGEDRTYGAAVQKHGIHFLCGEFGGHATCNLDGLTIVELSIDRLLHSMGMSTEPGVPLESGQARLLKVDGQKHYAFASHSGVFEPAFRLGDEVRAGQLAGRIHDPGQPNATPAEVHFSGAGLAICIRALAHVQAGDCLGHLASDTAWQ